MTSHGDACPNSTTNFSCLAPTIGTETGTDAVESTRVEIVVLRSLFILLDVACTIAGNVVSTLVIGKTSEFSDSVRVLMTSLCVADLGVGVTLLSSLFSSPVDRWVLGDACCKITAGLLAVCLSMSVFSLLGVSVDRLVAVRWPLRHPLLITGRRVRIACAALWLTSALTAVGNVFMHLESAVYIHQAAICYLDYAPSVESAPYEIFTAIVLCVIPLTIIVVIYANLLLISAKHTRRQRGAAVGRPSGRAADHSSAATGDGPGPGPSTGRGIEDANPGARENNARNRKALRMFLVVTLGFAACWVPHFAMRLYGSLSETRLPKAALMLYAWLPMSNSFWNVIIYTLMNGSFRRGVKKLLRRGSCLAEG